MSEKSSAYPYSNFQNVPWVLLLFTSKPLRNLNGVQCVRYQFVTMHKWQVRFCFMVLLGQFLSHRRTEKVRPAVADATVNVKYNLTSLWATPSVLRERICWKLKDLNKPILRWGSDIIGTEKWGCYPSSFRLEFTNHPFTSTPSPMLRSAGGGA